MKELQDVFYEVAKSLSDAVNKHLEEDLSSYEISKLGGSDIVKEVLAGFLEGMMTDEKLKSKMVKEISKCVMNTHKQKEKEHKAQFTKDTKLFKLSGGRIPCLNQCGFHRIKTKSEVLNGSNNFVCSDCTKKIEDETGDWTKAHQIFQKTNVYKIFGIN